MTYKEFKDGVIEMLLEEGEIVGTEKYRDRIIRVALLKALSFFPTFRPDQVITKTVEDVTADGPYVCYCSLPFGATIREAYLVPSEWGTEEEMAEYDHEDRLGPFEYYPWEDRHQLINGLARECDLFYSVSPDRNILLIHPTLDEKRQFLLTIESLGTKFKDGDVLNIPEPLEDRFIMACSNYVRGQFSKDVDRNAGMFGTNIVEFKRELQSIYKEIPR